MLTCSDVCSGQSVLGPGVCHYEEGREGGAYVHAGKCLRRSERPFLGFPPGHDEVRGRACQLEISSEIRVVVSIRQHTSAYVSIRQHTYVSIGDSEVRRRARQLEISSEIGVSRVVLEAASLSALQFVGGGGGAQRQPLVKPLA